MELKRSLDLYHFCLGKTTTKMENQIIVLGGGLTGLGRSVEANSRSLSNLQAIAIAPNGYQGAADSSATDGTAIGPTLAP